MNPDKVQTVGTAFADYDRQVRIANSKLGAILAIILMPAGVVLDHFVYEEHFWHFLRLRLLCSLGVGIVLGLFFTKFGSRHYRILGMTWYMLPALCIAWMIYAAKDPLSPYYAGLNIVLLGVGLILPWTYQENLLAGGMVIAMYLGASFLPGLNYETKYIVNNLYFLVLTALIVVVGSFFHSKLRFREFALRFELNEKQRELEAGNRKLVEQQKQLEEGNRKLVEQQKQLEEGNRKLVELDRIKSRFFANMSHELRTPLTLLIAPLETILYRKAAALDSESRNLLQTMHANGMRLLKLINDLLDLEKLEAGSVQIKREPLAIPEFLRGLVNSAQAVATDKRLKLETLIAGNVGACLTDRDKLEKIVLNLVFNAVKFTPAGGSVSVRAERRDGTLVLRVEDTGAGIAENHLPFIFDRFWQVDTSAQRKHQGTGIGLALVKELVEAQGGEVRAESQLGKGTTMSVELPYEEARVHDARPEPGRAPLAEPQVESNGGPQKEEWVADLYRRAELHPSLRPLQESLRREETSTQSSKPKALIADDEPDMLRFLVSQLGAHFQIFEAVDGQQAVDKASQFLPDVILLDMMMPEKDGLQVCRELRAKTATRNIPIILLTARADEETKLTALSAGASDFLSKPFSTTELHVRVNNLVQQHELQRKLARQNQILESALDDLQTAMRDLKDTQAQLVQAEKLAGLGRMSAGIIHEINNPLNFTKTGLYSLRKKEKFLPDTEREDFAEVIRDIEEGVDRVRTIVSDLRSFTHPDAENVDDVDIGKVVTSALRLVSSELKETKVQNDIPEGFTVPGNQNKLVQVFINFLQNSVDAIRRRQPPVSEPLIRISARAEGDRKLVIIRDNGEGIQPENMGKIFDPFFTTKDVGEGMGLGLSICYKLIANSGGRILVKSEPGHFTEFTLEFPEKISNLTEDNSLG